MLHGKRIISLCMSRLHDADNARFITELNQLLTRENCSLWIYNINSDLYWDDSQYNAETAVYDLIDYERSDAVIVMDEKIKCRTVADAIIEKSLHAGTPVVIVDGSHAHCSEVRYDYGSGFEKVVRHVLGVHHAKRPHFLGGAPDNPFSLERQRVFERVAADYGITVTPDMISFGYFWAKPAKAAAEQLVRRDVLPDAIICANDIMAFNVCDVLTEHGVRIPEDIIVTGFDGMDEIYFSSPSLTSVLCGVSGLSESVCRAVIDCMAHPGTSRSYAVEPELLLNCSCGCRGDAQIRDLGHSHSFNDRFYRYQDDNRDLAEMCERMQSFSSLEQSERTFHGNTLQDVCCLLNMRCTDYSTDYFRPDAPCQIDDTLLVFLDTDAPDHHPYEMPRQAIIPHLERVMCEEYPLIFSVLDYMNIPIGYMCFHFREYEITNYCKLPQVVSTLSIGLGGFINRQYQQYLIRQIQEMYRNDALTGLCNRMSFSRDFERLREAEGDRHLPLTVVMSDLDGLKTINDSFGHAAGDHAIATVAAALRENCPDSALCVRFGGDEMVAVIPGECDAEALVRGIVGFLHHYNADSGLPYQISTSIGVSRTVLEKNTDFETLIRDADHQMYEIKQARKQKRHS